MVVKPTIHTDVVRKLEEKRNLRKAQEIDRDMKRTIEHLDEVSKLSHKTFELQNACLDAAKTGNDPKINDLAKKKAAVARIPKAPKMDCSGGVCRIVPKKKK